MTPVPRDSRIEFLRVIGAFAVFAYHFMGDAASAVPGSWTDGALWAELHRASGGFGVSLFIIISGLVFTWSWSRTTGAGEFIATRLRGLLLIYWWVALPLIALALAVGRMAWDDMWKVPVWLSGFGGVSARTFFPVVDSWWYMTLAVQLVVWYPLLRRMQERVGATAFVVLASAFGAIFSVTMSNAGWGFAQMGWIGSRLLEFSIGMLLGSLVIRGQRATPRLGQALAVIVALGLWMGITRALHIEIVFAVVVVVLTLLILDEMPGRLSAWVNAVAPLSFAFFLSHSPWAKPVLSVIVGRMSAPCALALSAFVSLAVALCVAWFATWSFRRVRRHASERFGSKLGSGRLSK